MPRKAKISSRKGDDAAIIVGVDFGTTYSGVAWTQSSQAGSIDIISDWESVELYGNDKKKAPTVVSYDSQGEVSSWGYGVPPEDLAPKWFKLCLLDDEDITPQVRESVQLEASRELLKIAGKTAVEAIADYLRCLWDHTIESIDRSIGVNTRKNSKFQIVVTVPAIWPHYAQLRMGEAIENAGIMKPGPGGSPSLTFISEPEAAALASMQDLAGRVQFKKGDHFIICDAGGGTVDIITYTVAKLNPLTVRESVRGDGDLCGAFLLDEGFLRLLRDSIPRSIWDKLTMRAIKAILSEQWERGIKPAFRNTDRKFEISIPFGGTLQDRFFCPSLEIKKNDLFSIFQPVVTGVETLVQNQIAQVKKLHGKLPKHIILVGGLGKSLYLHQRLAYLMKGKVEVLQSGGEQPWTAVCRGAVIKGLTQSNLSQTLSVAIDSRIARKSYGTLFNAWPFDPAEHNQLDMSYCHVLQEFLALDQTEWFLKINDELTPGKPISKTFWQDIDNPTDEIEVDIVTSDSIEPPNRKDASVKKLCSITISKIPNFEKLPLWTNTEGKPYRRVQYDVKMVCDDASLDIGVYHKGRRLGSRNVSVDFGSGSAEAK